MGDVKVDSLTRRAAIGAAAGCGVLYAAAQQPFGLWPLAFVCLVPLQRALLGRRPAPRAALGYIAGGTAGLLAATLPLSVAFSAFFDRPVWQGALVPLLAGQFFGGGSFALFAWLAGDGTSGRAAALRAAAAFAGAEWLRSILLTGFPWLLLGQALTPVPQLAALAAWGGAPLLAIWLVGINGALLLMLLPDRRRDGAIGLAVLALAGVGVQLLPTGHTPDASAPPGTVRLAPPGTPETDGALRIILVQPAVPLSWWRDPARSADNLERLVELTREGGEADLVVWPENSIQVLLPANLGLVQRALNQLSPKPDWLLLGAPRYDLDAPERVFNAAVLFASDGRLVAHHDKVHRVPFTEYAPWPLAALGLDRPLTAAGVAPRALPVAETRVGALICYEVLFAGLGRALAREGAGVLVNLSNDAYFGESGGAEQHLAAAVLRALEFRKPVLRATTTGVTAAIDSSGRLVARLSQGEPGVLRVDVWPSSSLTPYARIGDAWAWVGLAAAALVTFRELLAIQRSKR